jgi:hypothetical protein
MLSNVVFGLRQVAAGLDVEFPAADVLNAGALHAAIADGALAEGRVDDREQQIGGSGRSLEPPWASFLNPLGIFLRTSIPFI